MCRIYLIYDYNTYSNLCRNMSETNTCYDAIMKHVFVAVASETTTNVNACVERIYKSEKASAMQRYGLIEARDTDL